MGIKDFIVFRVGKVIDFLNKCWDNYQWHSIERKTHQKFKFLRQGNGGLTIEHCEGFKIDSTSQLKANTFINAWGGVTIGKYFHTGRGLTIWTSNHKYNGGEFIPYGMENDLKPVVIEDFVWTGSNVTILPGVTIGEGAVIGAGSVVTKDIPKYAVAAGNPCRVIKYRDIEQFENLKKQQKFL